MNNVAETKKTEEKPKPKKQDKFLTIVVKYTDTGKKNSYDVTDFMSYIIDAIKNYDDNCTYDDYRFDLYGICVEEDSEIAEQKNEYIRAINS